MNDSSIVYFFKPKCLFDFSNKKSDELTVTRVINAHKEKTVTTLTFDFSSLILHWQDLEEGIISIRPEESLIATQPIGLAAL